MDKMDGFSNGVVIPSLMIVYRRSIFMHTDGLIGIQKFGASVASACRPVVCQMSCTRNNNEEGIVLRLRNVALESRYANTFGVSSSLSL